MRVLKKCYLVWKIPPVTAWSGRNIFEPLHDQRSQFLGYMVVKFVTRVPSRVKHLT